MSGRGGGRGYFSESGALSKEVTVTMRTSTLGILGEGRSEGNNRDEARCHIPPDPILHDPNYQMQNQKDKLQG